MVHNMQKIVNRESPEHRNSRLPKFHDIRSFKGLELKLNNWSHNFTYVRRKLLCDKLHPRETNEDYDSIEDDQQVLLKNNTDYMLPIVKSLLKGGNLNTIVLIENRKFVCNGLILSTYSKYFKKLRRHTEIDLRDSFIAVKTFDYIYKWMMKSVTRMQTAYLVPVIRTAYFLQITTLLQLCFTLLEADRFKELAAFDLIYQMRFSADISQVNEAISSRISSCALLALCSRQFLCLSDFQICHLLRSSFLAVNSEAEILFSALLWLMEGWPARRAHVLKVLRCIRYAYISPILLCYLNEPEMDYVGPFGCILREFHKFEEAKHLIQDGIFYSTIVITMHKDNTLLQQSDYLEHKLMIPRRWIEDMRCEYHRPVSIYCPNMRYVSYESFLEYLKIWKCSSLRYESYLIYPSDGQVTVNKRKIELNAKKRAEKNSLNGKCQKVAEFDFVLPKTCCTPWLKDFKPSKFWKNWEKKDVL